MTRKRMKKLIMAIGYPRNVANEVAFYIEVQGLQYKDFREILEEIRDNADVVRNRYEAMVEDNNRYHDLAKRIVPTAENPYPFASLNFPLDFDLCNRYRLTRVLELHQIRSARRMNKRLASVFRKAAIAAHEAETAFEKLGTAVDGFEVGFCSPPYEVIPPTNPHRIKSSFGGKPNPWIPDAWATGNRNPWELGVGHE